MDKKMDSELVELLQTAETGEVLLLNKLIEYKDVLVKTLNADLEQFNDLTFTYMIRKNKLLLETEWSKVISGRVTESLKTAYIDTKLSDLLADKSVVEENVAKTKREIDLVNDRISAEKYHLRLLLK